MIEGFAKALEVAAKYAWGIFVVCLFVILIPTKAASYMGLTILNDQYLGFWWLGLIFSAAICGSSIFTRFTAWRSEKYQEAKFELTVIKRLYSLDPSEFKWIAFCLFKNIQTLNATAINPAANSLLSKGILTRGSGSILDLPYHIRDIVWEFLQKNREQFVPDEVLNDPIKINMLKSFARSLKELF